MSNPTYRDILSRHFEERVSRNSTYSLRAFARDIDLHPARLSMVLRKKQGLSAKTGAGIAARLGLSQNESQLFCELIESEHARTPVGRQVAKIKATTLLRFQSSELNLDTFAIVSDWHHFAILELSELDGFVFEPAKVAKALGLHLDVANAAIERLKRVGLLSLKNGKLCANSDVTITTNGVPSDAIKKFHRQMLEKAKAAIDSQTIEERDLSSLTIAIGPEQIPIAKEQIKNFRRSFEKAIGPADKKTQLYSLNIQFFKLSQDSKGDPK